MIECVKGCGRRVRVTRRGMCHACYETHRHRQKAYGRWQPDRHDAEPVRQHVQALRAAGMGRRRIAELAGVADSSIQHLFTPRAGRSAPALYVKQETAERILAVQPEDIAAAVAGGALVDGTGTARRLQALVAIGYTQAALAELIGFTPANSTELFRGHPVRATTARKVAALYDQLSMTPGSSQRARTRADKLGWVPPLAWDDDTIDDPAAQPDTGLQRRVPFQEEYQELRELGYNDTAIADRMGIQLASLYRQLERHGIRGAA